MSVTACCSAWRVLCCSMCLFLYGSFCLGALKYDLSTLFSTLFLQKSLQFILGYLKNRCLDVYTQYHLRYTKNVFHIGFDLNWHVVITTFMHFLCWFISTLKIFVYIKILLFKLMFWINTTQQTVYTCNRIGVR